MFPFRRVFFGFQIQYQRLPHEESKTMVLATIKSATKVLTLKTCLQLIGLTAARYHSWVKRQVANARNCIEQTTPMQGARPPIKNADSAPVAPEEDKLRLPHTSSTTSSLSSHTGSLSSPSPSLFATGSTPTNSYSPASTPSSPGVSNV